MINVNHLVKKYGLVTALNDVSFQVQKGEIVGLLGPNGAGKSTLMRVLTCFLPATEGQVEVAGCDVFSDPVGVRRAVGYMPESVPLYDDMRVLEYLRYRGTLKGLDGKRRRKRIADVVETCGLGDMRRRLIAKLSRGYRQRVGLADALLAQPRVLILDEPVANLDPAQIRQMRELIQHLGGEYTVLLSSHILSEVESLCPRVLIMRRGRIVASDAPERLIGAARGQDQILIEATGAEAAAMARCFRGVPHVVAVHTEALDEGWCRLVCDVAQGADARGALFEAAAAEGLLLRELHRRPLNLEDVFIAVTSGPEVGERSAAS